MFRGNQELCLKIKESHIATMAKYMAEFEDVYEISQFFNIVVKIESLQLAIRRNQNMVIKQLMLYRDETIKLVDPKDDAVRIKMMVQGSAKTKAMGDLDKKSAEYKKWWVSDENRHLLYHVRLVRMLATCCEGDNRFIESMCQNIFSPKQLLEVLVNENITMNFRRPYMRFFLWAYLNSDSSSIEAELGPIQMRSDIWFWMEKMIDQTYTIFRKDLTKIFETDEGEQDVIFVMEASIPFLRVFYERYYHLSDTLMRALPDHRACVERSADCMLDFIDRMNAVPEFGTKQRVKDATTVLLVMQANGNVLSEQQLNRLDIFLKLELERVAEVPPKRRHVETDDEGKVFLQEAEVGLDKVFMIKSARRDWFNYYEEELKLNDLIHNFTRNLSKAYKADTSTPRYSRSLASGAGMPLGREYQTQVAAFVEYDMGGTALSSLDVGELFGKEQARYTGLKKSAQVLVHALQSSRASYDKLDESQKMVQFELDLKHLRLLRAPISNELLRMPTNSKYNEEEIRAVARGIAKVQNDLNAINVPAVILIMCTSPEEFTVRASLRLLAMMLHGGNREIQNSFLFSFKATRNEGFFLDLRDRIVGSAVAVKEARSLQSQLARDRTKRAKLLTSTIKIATAQRSSKDRNGSYGGGSGNFDSVAHSSDGDSSVKKGNDNNKKKGPVHEDSRDDILLSEVVPPKSPPKSPAPPASPAAVSLMADTDAEKMANKLSEEDHEDIVKFGSLVGFTELIFHILQLFCEGHNREMKSYMREQTGNIKMFNLVTESVEYMKVVYMNVDGQSLSLACQVMETIVEFTMGEHDNQLAVFDAKVVDIVNHLVRLPTYDNNKHHTFLLKRVCCILIRTFVEDNNSTARGLARELYAALDILAIRQVMKQYAPGPHHGDALSKPDVDPITKAKIDYDPHEIGYICYTILCLIRDQLIDDIPDIERILHLRVFGQQRKTTRTGKMDQTEFTTHCLDSMRIEFEEDIKDKDERSVFKILKTKAEEEAKMIDLFSIHIESIEIVRDKEIQKVYFPVGVQRKTLNQTRRDKVLWSVNRDSPNDKINDFLDRSETLRDEMVYQERLQQNPIFRGIINSEAYLYHAFMLLTLAINFIMIGTWSDDGLGDILPVTPWWYHATIYGLGSVHLFLACMIVIEYLLENPIRSWRDLLKQMFIYYLIFVGMSAGGIFTDGYLFCFHLLHVVMKNDILQRALMSVTKNGKTLLLVAMLGVILIYIYTVVAFAFYRESYQPSNAMYCGTLGQCFVTTLNYGLRGGGGIGDYLTFTQYTWNYAGLRTIFELSFFILITTIGLNIIFGLIIDTFSELRDEKFQIAEDMRTNCFICSLRAYDFDKEGVTFAYHVKHEHNMWSYLFFLNYLEEKDQNEYTPHEAYVAEIVAQTRKDSAEKQADKEKDKAQQKDRDAARWFPINRALSLQQTNDELDDRLENIEKKLEQIINRFKLEDESRLIQNQHSLQQRLHLLASADE